MREVVIVPAWRRPDFLYACLERLRCADEGTQHYWIALDRGHDKRVAEVARRFVGTMGARGRVIERTHAYRGNSFNVLTSYREAVEAGYEMIHLVEEDVFVADDYFAFHRCAHQLVPGVFAVSGARNQNYPNDPEPEPGAIYLHGMYQSVAVSFRASALAPVLEHATVPYFRDPIGYCKRAFPKTRLPVGHAEQDGLIHRVAEATHARIAYPTEPVAYHAGFMGYHRNGEPALVPGKSVQVAAAELLSMDAAELNRRAHSYPDHQVVDVRAVRAAPDHVVVWPVVPLAGTWV